MANKNYMLNDKFPKTIKNATSTSDGLMSAEDKSRLDSVFEYGLLSPATPDKDGIMTKEDKSKLDSLSGKTDYVHPDDENTRHVTDEQINRWDNQVKYSNSNPTPITLGGINKGTTFNNMDYSTLITKLLYPYVDPTISNISVTPSNTLLEKGNMFTMTQIQFKITTPSLQDTESIHYDFKMNGSIINTLDTNNRTVTISTNNLISNDSSITVEVIDNINQKQKSFSLISYKFIYPMYYGVINSNDTINETLIKSKTKLLQQKGTKTLKFTTNNQKMIFAYPKEYGKLTSVYDVNNFNVIGTFTVQEVSIVGNDTNTTTYYVYTNDLSSVTNYEMKFVF